MQTTEKKVAFVVQKMMFCDEEDFEGLLSIIFMRGHYNLVSSLFDETALYPDHTSCKFLIRTYIPLYMTVLQETKMFFILSYKQGLQRCETKRDRDKGLQQKGRQHHGKVEMQG